MKAADNPVRAEYAKRAAAALDRLEGGPQQREIKLLKRQVADAESTIEKLRDQLKRERDRAGAAETDLEAQQKKLRKARARTNKKPEPINLGRPTRAMILRVMSEVSGYLEHQITSQQRLRELAWARQTAAYLMAQLTTSTLPQIGDTLGKRDHTTILYAVKVTKERLREGNPQVTQWVAEAQELVDERVRQARDKVSS